jgi:translocation and assembly module TamB
LGKDVRLRGFGLDGYVSGELAVLDRPGRAAQANGNLSVTGTYKAYGRPLTIRRANLTYVNAAYNNPILDVLAEHEFEEVTVGVRVRGSAAAPETTVTSSPSMSTAEALSWLMLGRSLNTASGTESRQISASALALSAGSGLLAQQLGGRLGLDSAGIVETRSLGGSTLLVGKQISPRLFLSYGVSLIGSGQVVMLKYLLGRGLNLSIESSKVEAAGAINWRREK